MLTSKVYAILNKAPLAREGQTTYHGEKYLFKVHHNSVAVVHMVEMIRKGDYKDALSDYNNSIFIKTLSDLKKRVATCS